MTYHYLMDLALILLSTKVLGILTKRIQMPQVVGALVAGLILGPAMLNVLSETEFLTQLSELGVIVLMFSAGMGTDIQELKHSGKAGFLVALLGVIVPLVLGTGLAMLADRTGMIETSGFLEDVFIGTILTATSVSITVETLKEIGKLDTKVGNTILAAALIDDVLGLIALTIVSSLSGGQDSIALVLLKIVLFFVFSTVVSFLAHKFFCWLMALWPGRERRRYPVLAFVLCLLMAYCAEEFFGVADITGAYVAGLVISCTPKSSYIQSPAADFCGHQDRRLRPGRKALSFHWQGEPAGGRGHGLPRRGGADRSQPGPGAGSAVRDPDGTGHHHRGGRHDPHTHPAEAGIPARRTAGQRGGQQSGRPL